MIRACVFYEFVAYTNCFNGSLIKLVTFILVRVSLVCVSDPNKLDSLITDIHHLLVIHHILVKYILLDL